jgi:hypothetical protein
VIKQVVRFTWSTRHTLVTGRGNVRAVCGRWMDNDRRITVVLADVTCRQCLLVVAAIAEHEV